MDKSSWNSFAGIYELFMKKDDRAYTNVCRRIRKEIADKKVLEIGCGTGIISRRVAQVSNEYIAVDYAEDMIAEAWKRPRPAHLSYRVADGTALPFDDDSFDAVIIANCLHIVPDPVAILNETKRVLRPGGLLIAPTFTHAEMTEGQNVLADLMETFTGFEAAHQWTPESYKAFLNENGFLVLRGKRIKASFPLTYLVCVRAEDVEQGNFVPEGKKEDEKEEE